MDIDLSAFHFLRPAWLLLCVPALWLPWAWRRRRDPRARWQHIIAPRLLDHLIVSGGASARLHPVDTVAAALVLGAVAVAGPTWAQVHSPFNQDQAPMVVALALSTSMDASDVAPTRLERAKAKVQAIAAARKGARTGLVVYAGSAHAVVPPTSDATMLSLYVPALATDLMPRDGKRVDLALAAAEAMLAQDKVPGTVVLIGDGFDASARQAFVTRAKASRQQLLWLAVGTAQGGALRRPDGSVRTDDNGRPAVAGVDTDAMQTLAREADIPLASVRADDDDVTWVTRRAQAFLRAQEDGGQNARWQENGFWLVVPILLLLLFSFRRGWTVKWLPVVVLAAGMASAPGLSHAQADELGGGAASAAPAEDVAPDGRWQWLVDAFATRDQQGRWYFEHGDFARAAARFDDPAWRGRAQYAAGNYQDALATFSELFAHTNSASAAFYMGNALAQLDDVDGAMQAYRHALVLRPGWPPAQANLALMVARKQAQTPPDEQAPNLKPDEVRFDAPKGKGQAAMVTMPTTEDVWLRGLNTSPAVFLKQRFALETQARAPTPAATTRGTQ